MNVGGPGTVVKAACLERRRSRVQTPLSVSKKLNVIPRSLKKIQYRGEPLDIRQPGFEFRILCLEVKCHLIHLTILVRFPWSDLAHMWPIGGLKPLIFPLLGGGPRVVVSTAAFHARVRCSVPGLGGLKETKMFLPHPRVKVTIVGSLRDREVACSASDHQGILCLEGQCHLIHLTILGRFPWPSLAHMGTKVT